MQKPISIQMPLPNHNLPLGNPSGKLHGELPQIMAEMHGTEVVVENRQKIPGILPKAFSNHHLAILIIFCHPFLSGPCQTNSFKLGHRYQPSEKVRMNTMTAGTHAVLIMIINGMRILKAVNRQLPLPHQR